MRFVLIAAALAATQAGVRAQSPAETTDPVARAMERIEASVERRALAADRIIVAAKLLNESGLVEAKVHSLQQSGWPKPEELAAANTIVIYSDGGGGHPFNAHLDELAELTKKGTGIVCLHYGVETTIGKPGQAFIDWTGGYFEMNWSVNPHWTIKDAVLAKDHPIARAEQIPEREEDQRQSEQC